MEISIVSQNSIKLKGKIASIIMDPIENTSTQAFAVLLSKKSSLKFTKIEDLRLVIFGAGEYEVGGVKITGIPADDECVYSGDMDGGRFVIGSSKAIEKILSKLDETPIVIINAQENFNASIVSTLSPSVCVIYGEGKEQALKALGKESLPSTSKYSFKADKLPDETEFVSLG